MANYRNELNAVIARHVHAAVDDAIGVYRALIGVGAASTGKRRGRPPGAASASAPSRPKKFIRRSARQIAGSVGRVVAFISKHPGLRSEQIVKALGGDASGVSDALARLRASGRVKTDGIKRAMTYSIAQGAAKKANKGS